MVGLRQRVPSSDGHAGTLAECGTCVRSARVKVEQGPIRAAMQQYRRSFKEAPRTDDSRSNTALADLQLESSSG